MAERILVTGATGAVGGPLVRSLVARGAEVRALCRSARRAAEAQLPPQVEVVVGDLTQPSALHDALREVDRVFLVLAEDAGSAFAEAVRGGVRPRHVVLLSAAAPERAGEDNPLFAKHVLGEWRLRALRVPSTVLRPGPFASVALRWRRSIAERRTVEAVHPHLTMPLVDPLDLAEVALARLCAAVPEYEELPLTGPEALTVPQIAEVLGDVLDVPLTVRKLSAEDWVRSVADEVPASYARALLGVEEHLARTPARVAPTVQRVLGRPARPFRVWAARNASVFQVGSRAG